MKRKAKASQRTKPVLPLKDIDEAIIHCIEQDPKIILKEIPGKLEKCGGLAKTVSYPTVQRHVKKLINAEVILQQPSINWVAAGYLVSYQVGIHIDPVVLRDKSIKDKQYDSQEGLADYILEEIVKNEPFKNKMVIGDVYILLGGNVDLAVDFYAKDDKTASKFIINALRKLPGVSNTVSAKLAYSSRYGWLSKNGDEDDS